MKILTFLCTVAFVVLYCLVGGAMLMLFEREPEEAFKIQANLTVQAIKQNNSCLTDTDLVAFEDVISDMSKSSILLRPDSTIFYRSQFDYRSSVMLSCLYFSGIGVRHTGVGSVGAKVFSVFFILFAIYFIFFITYAISEVFNVLTMALFPHLAGKDLQKGKFIAVRQSILVSIAIIFLVLIPAAIISYIEPWSFANTVYVCLVYLITLGFSDFVPGNAVIERSEDFIQWYRMFVGVWVMFASMWLYVIMLQYSWIVGYFFWQTTDMAVKENIEAAKKKLNKKSARESIKDFLKRRRKEWKNQTTTPQTTIQTTTPQTKAQDHF